MENDLDRELRFHFETQVANKVEAGMCEPEARRTARLEFGGLEQVKEDCRESRGTMWVDSILQDLRFGTRILARSPGFTCAAVVVLALGIGVATLAFSLYNLVALQPIPVRGPASLVSIQRRSPRNIEPGVPQASIVYYRDNAKSLSAVMETMAGPPMVLGHGEQRVRPSFVSSNYFAELGEPAAVGRLFDPAREVSAGSPPVAVLSFQFWQREFGGDPSVVGKTIYVGGKAVTLAGVTAEKFASLGTDDPDIWLPLVQHSYFVEGSQALDDPKFEGMIVMWGRLADGVSLSAAAQELTSLTNQLRRLYPAVIWDREHIVVTPGAHFVSLEDSAPLLAVGAVFVILILGVACANLGGLLMARGAGRQQEIQVRLDLGARRSRLFRQLFTESLLLGMLGSIAALPLSFGVLRIALVSAGAPQWMSASPDWRVLVFTATMGFVAALFFGLLPTLKMVRRKKGKARGQQFVVCAQVAASCVLLILAGLLVRATMHTLYTDPGFGYEQVLAVDPGLSEHGYTPAAAKAYLDQLQDRLRSVPGVTSVSIALSPPLVTREVMITSIDVDGRRVLIYPNWVGPEFFQTMGIPLLRGRYLRAGETHAVVLSESLARKRWPNEDPIGKRWKTGQDVVVGVVGNTRAMEMNNTDATEIYASPADGRLPEMSVLVKTVGAPEGVTPAIRAIAGSLDPKLFPEITPLKVGFRKNVARVEQLATIVSMLGSMATFLALVGLLGLVSYAVSQRTRELAIRLALGAGRGVIFSTVLSRFALPVLAGLVLGVGMAAGLSQVIRRGLYGISGLDPLSYVGTTVLLLAILIVAAMIPIRRALHLDVARVLHEG